MLKRTMGFLAVCLMVPAMAAAQTDSGGGPGSGGSGDGGPGGGMGHGHGRHGGEGGPPTGDHPSGPPSLPQTPANQVQIVGVITAIDPATQRITIQYQENDALNLPAGTTPFEVSKSALMNGVTVGEKVRFRVDSHQIAEIKPF